jgi:hypothetical protein
MVDQVYHADIRERDTVDVAWEKEPSLNVD